MGKFLSIYIYNSMGKFLGSRGFVGSLSFCAGLVAPLYTTCVLRGAFTLFEIYIFTYKKEKKKFLCARDFFYDLVSLELREMR
jgi:hypothetical protein